MKKLLTATAMCICVAGSYAYNVKLHAVDADGADEVYATCRIFTLTDSIKPAVAGLTDSLGRYVVELDSLGTYRLRIEAAGSNTGYFRQFALTEENPSIDLGDIALSDISQLNEVTVTAQRPLVVKQIDRIGYDVQADPDVLTLTTRDMLRNVPMVAVDGEGNITINGSSNFKVFKNGRPNNSMTKNAKDILAAIPASMIKTIEVITEPGAKYDAEGIGAILNIVTIDNVLIKGVVGNVSAGYDVYNNSGQANFYVMTQVNKVTVSFHAGAQQLGEKNTTYYSDINRVYDSGITESGAGSGSSQGGIGWLSGSGSWELNKYNLFTFELAGYYFNTKPKGLTSVSRWDSDGVLSSSYQSSYNYPKSAYLDFNGNFNYQLSTNVKGESLTVSYAVSTTDQNSKTHTEYSDVEGDLFSYSAIDGVSDLNFIEHTFQADWVRPFGNTHNLEVGGKYILRRNTSKDTRDYADWMTTESEFKHITDVGALYAQYTAKLEKVSLRAGLRYEYSKLKAEYPDGSEQPFSSVFNDFVPSASASWNISDVHSLTFNYASRINRPGIAYLNPTVKYEPGNVSSGNPDLESALSNSFKLTYMFIKPKLNFNISADYSFNNDNISAVQYADDEDIFHRTYENIGKVRNLSLSTFAQWTATPKTRFMINASATYKRYEQEGYELTRWEPFVYFRIQQDLPYKLKASFGGYYSGGNVSSVYSYSECVSPIPINWTLSLTRAFLKQDRLNVSIMANNFIGDHRSVYKSYTVNGNVKSISGNRSNNLRVVLSVSYRFGSLNASVKKTASSISNDDLVGRK